MITAYNITREDVYEARDARLVDVRTISDALATLAGACVDDDGATGDAALEAVAEALNAIHEGG